MILNANLLSGHRRPFTLAPEAILSRHSETMVTAEPYLKVTVSPLFSNFSFSWSSCPLICLVRISSYETALLSPFQDCLSNSTMATATTTISAITTTLIPHPALCKSRQPVFPISNLPYELRQLIYACYLSLLPPLNINTTTLQRIPQPALLRSSPLFACDIAPPLYYQHATFSFASVNDLVLFARPPHGRLVRSIHILSQHDRRGGDWVYSAQRCFPGLEEIVFEFSSVSESQLNLEGWWERVVDALREGRGSKRGWMRVSVEKDGGECLTEVL